MSSEIVPIAESVFRKFFRSRAYVARPESETPLPVWPRHQNFNEDRLLKPLALVSNEYVHPSKCFYSETAFLDEGASVLVLFGNRICHAAHDLRSRDGPHNKNLHKARRGFSPRSISRPER